jgi:hypothetical protein
MARPGGNPDPQRPSHPLHDALEKYGVPSEAIPQIARRLLLFRPVSKTVHGAFDEDMAARLLRLSDGRPDPEAKWSTLSSAERQRAKREWNALGRTRVEHYRAKRPPTSTGPSRAGRPTLIDPALLLYCIRVLCEAKCRTDFQFSRNLKGRPVGPMWQALVAIFPLMQSYVAVRSNMAVIDSHSIGDHAEAIANDIKLGKSKIFQDLCEKLGLGPAAEDVANNADTFRLAFAVARKARRSKR